jgi:hypothetical protein
MVTAGFIEQIAIKLVANTGTLIELWPPMRVAEIRLKV